MNTHEGAKISDRPLHMQTHSEQSTMIDTNESDIQGTSADELLAKCTESRRSLPRAPSLWGPPNVGMMRFHSRRDTDTGTQRVVSPKRMASFQNKTGIADESIDILKEGSILEVEETRRELEDIVHSGYLHVQDLKIDPEPDLDKEMKVSTQRRSH